MRKTFLLISFAVLSAVTVRAQGPMSPPARPPVPMTSAQQEQMLRKDAPPDATKTPAKPDATSNTIKIPIATTARMTSGNAAIDNVIREAANTHGVDPVLILSLMRHESSFNVGAISPKGASGLMQLMPATAVRFGVKNIFDVRENIFGGTRYLRWLLDRFNGDVRLALAGYNAGEGAVEFYGNRIPPFSETQNYVRAIYARYVNLRFGTTVPAIAANAPSGNSEAAKTVESPKEKIPTYNQIIIFKTSGDTATAKMP